MATQGVHRDERALLTGGVATVVPVEEGTNATSRVELDNGVVGYHKPFAHLNDELAAHFGHDSPVQPLHEAAAWRLAERMGPPWSEIVPPCVLREVDGELGSLALERPGRPNVMKPWDVPEWRAAAFFDAVIGQQDRHPGNFLVAGDRVTLIDHGYCFERGGDLHNFSWFHAVRWADDSREVTGEELDVLHRIRLSPDGMGLKGMLSPERFEALLSRVNQMRTLGELVEPDERALRRQQGAMMFG